MDRRDAVLDASFWINAHRADLVKFLPDYFNLRAPTAVIEEIEYVPSAVGQLSPAGESFRHWRQVGRLEIQDPTRAVDWFDRGENAAIALAQEQGYALLLDDQAPYHLAKARGLKTIGTTDFVVLLYADGRLSYDDALRVLVSLGIAKDLKRAAMTTVGLLAPKRSERDDNDAS
jgi:predicted nucleic acid-binding protein